MTLTQKPFRFGKAISPFASHPPLGNTGVKLTKYPLVHDENEDEPKITLEIAKYDGEGTEFGTDWFNASVLVPISQAQGLVHDLAGYLEDELQLIGSVKMRGSCEVFNETYRTTRGSLIYLASDEAAIAKYNGYAKIYISICGESFRALGLEGQFRFFIAINSHKYDLKFPSEAKKYRDLNVHLQGSCKWKAGRLDIGCSDFNRKLPMKKMLEACRKKNFRGFAKCRHIDDFESEGTIYLGARASEVLRRAYDEFVKTGGIRDALRFESEFKNMSAQVIYETLLKLIESRDYDLDLIQDAAYQFLKEVCFGGFDFIDRFEDSEERETHLDRCKRLDWWQEYLDYVEASGIRLPSPSVKKTIEAKIEWVVKQVLPTIALIKRARPADFIPWLLEAVRQADDRITESAAAMLRVWKGEILSSISPPLPDYGVEF